MVRVETTAQPLARARRAALSLPAFRRLAWASVAMLVIIVATGATVRLTGSGLGCEHWPGCEQHHFEPRSFHSYIEFGNRVVAFFTILATLAAFVGAVRARLSTRLRVLALVVFLGTLAQAPLGAITIHFHLNPWLVLSHFLLSVVVLTLGVALAVEVSPRPSVRVPGWVRRASVIVWAAGGVLIVSGTLATASGPHPGSTVVRRLWSFQPAVYWHVRATAVFGICFAIMLVWLYRTRSPHLRAALVVLGLLLAQMVVGEVQYRTHLPWWLVLVHVTIATTVWAALTAFMVRLWRPARAA
jgi:cytochrome c oxidase assembly protein subunit 15